MNISKKLLIFFYCIAFFVASNCVFAVDELIDFKVNHAALISRNDIQTIFNLGEKTKDETGQPQGRIEKLLPLMQAKGVPESWLDWFSRKYGQSGKIGYKKLAAAIFYPYEILETTHKQHFQQMNYAFKASIMSSSSLDTDGPGRVMAKSLTADLGSNIDSDEEFLHLLDLGFIVSSSSFIDKVKAYEETRAGTLNRLKPQILSSGTAIQTLNLGLILKHFDRDDEALECFETSRQKGSLRADIEMGNILLKRNLEEGISFFRSLGVHGVWKIAQCYRYGINTERRLDIANGLYLEALSDGDVNHFPEILYDAADFAVYYAYSQPNSKIFQAVMTSAIKRFSEAGELHLGLGYLRAAEESLAVTVAFPSIVDSYFSLDFSEKAAKRALMEGHAGKTTSLLEKLQIDDNADMIVIRGYAEQIDRYFGA